MLKLPNTDKPLTVIGLMSGTSVDGVDACCVRLEMPADRLQYEILATHSLPMPADLRDRLLACMRNEPVALAELCRLNVVVGELFAQAVLALLEANGLKPQDIDAIGSHGQTVFHLPPTGNAAGATLQIGEPSIIAERIGILTVADFRPRDMAAGGQGAPLVCYADSLLFHSAETGRCIQNIGGIGNVTVLPRHGDPLAFDTGPGNMLIDGAMARLFGAARDDRGATAARGQVHPEMLAALLSHPYLDQPPPKTTGREDFGHAFLETNVAPWFDTVRPEDIIATVTHTTARTIVEAYQRFVLPLHAMDEVIVGGGGVYNTTLMMQLQTLLAALPHPLTLKTHEDFGIPNQYKESLAFALLAWATLQGQPNNLPACTGAQHPVIMGKILPGRMA